MHSFLVLCSCLVLFLDDQRGRDPAAPPSLSSVLVFHVERLRSSLFILLIPIIIFIFTLFLTLIRETLGRETREIIPFPSSSSSSFPLNDYHSVFTQIHTRERVTSTHHLFFRLGDFLLFVRFSLYSFFVIILCYIILL